MNELTYFNSNSRERKRKIRSITKEFKEYKRKHDKEYYQRSKVRKRDSLRSKELKIISKEIGNCTRCYNPKEDKEDQHAYCLKCRILQKEYNRRYRKRKK